MKDNNNLEKNTQYIDEILNIEVSNLDTSEIYKKAEDFMLKIIRNETIPKEDKIEIGKKVVEHFSLSKEQKEKLSNICKIEYLKTNQGKDEQLQKILEDMSDDSDYTQEFVPYMDFSKNHGLSYMALTRDKKGKIQKYFVSSKKEIIEYSACDEQGIYFKHKKNNSEFSMKSYISFIKEEDNVTAPDVFEEIKKQLKKYIIFPKEELYDVVSLWIMHTYVYCIFRYVPYIWLNATAGSGKSTAMDIIIGLSFNGFCTAGCTAPVIFRTIENNGCTLGLDEFENMTGEDKTLLNTILNIGFKAGTKVSRCSDKNYEPVEFSPFSPKILAGISNISNVLLTRCIKINMERAKDISKIQDFNCNDIELKAVFKNIKNKLHIFGLKYIDQIYEIYNDKDLFALEQNYTPREKDLWKPLLTISKIVDDEGNKKTRDSIHEYSKILHTELEKSKCTDVKPRLLLFLEEYIKGSYFDVYPNWYSNYDLIIDINESQEFSEPISKEAFGKYMTEFGFEKAFRSIVSSSVKARKRTGYFITQEKINEAKEKLGLEI